MKDKNMKKKVPCMGITNRIERNMGEKDEMFYVVFLDYDNIKFDVLTKELEMLCRKWDLGWIYILDSKGDGKHYHVMCPTIVSAYEYLGILWDSSCDMPYKKSFFLLKEKTLRISSKGDKRKLQYPHICGLVQSDHSSKPYSWGHLKFIEHYYKGELPPLERCENTEVEFVKYSTELHDENAFGLEIKGGDKNV